jgi:hypothetical protein
MQRVGSFLTARLTGRSLREIGEAQDPPITAQAVHIAIKTALRHAVVEPHEDAVRLEALRLDAIMNGGLFQRAVDGDLGAIDRVLAIMQRRARLLGLDLQPSGLFVRGPYEEPIDPRTVKIEIIGDPEPDRVKFLEEERERLLALVGDNDRTLN